MYEIRIKRNQQNFQIKNRQENVKVVSVGKRGIGLISGGLEGQYLRKASNNDYEVEWHSPLSDEISDSGQNHRFVTAGQLALIDSALQPGDALVAGDNISLLTNDAGYISNLTSFTTDDLAEGSNLYWTQARFNSAFSAKSTSDLPEGSNLYYTDVRADARITAQKGVADGIATLGSDGKIPTSQLPALALTETFVVASQVAMLALTAQPGDVAVRTDQNKSYILTASPASTLGNWQELLTPTDSVLSVNGQTGAVSLTTTNIAEGTNLYYTDARVQTFGDNRYLQLSGGTMTGKLTMNVSGDFGIDLGTSAMKANKIVVDGTPRSFAFPYTINSYQPETFIYLDNQFNVFRIGAQHPSAITSIAFELPNNNEYQDVMSLSKTSLSPAAALNDTIFLGGTSNRWEGLYLGSGGMFSNSDIALSSASLEITPAPSADVTESGVIATLTAGEDLVFGDVVYFKSDGKMGKTDADAIATSYAQAMALATIANNASGKFLLLGFVRNDAWAWTVGGVIYLSTTAGGLTQTAPSATDDVVNPVGIATHADRMLFRPNQSLGVVA